MTTETSTPILCELFASHRPSNIANARQLSYLWGAWDFLPPVYCVDDEILMQLIADPSNRPGAKKNQLVALDPTVTPTLSVERQGGELPFAGLPSGQPGVWDGAVWSFPTLKIDRKGVAGFSFRLTVVAQIAGEDHPTVLTVDPEMVVGPGKRGLGAA